MRCCALSEAKGMIIKMKKPKFLYYLQYRISELILMLALSSLSAQVVAKYELRTFNLSTYPTGSFAEWKWKSY